MSDITKLFQRGTKKRDLSDKYETGEDPKKVREGSLDCSQISQTSDIPDDIFTESLNSPDCVAILFNCLKNLESKIREISVSSKETTASQIKGNKQLSDSTDFVQLISGKFDEYEKDRNAKDELIIKLHTQVMKLTDKVSNLSVQVHEQEQYSRWNCLLIHGVGENRNEDTDTLSINIINERLGLDVQPSDIDRTHRIGNKNKARKKGREMIIKFTRYNTRKKVFVNKRKFKETNISVTESLTSLRMTKLKDARDEYGFNKVWTSDDRIMVMEKGSAKPKVIYGWLLNQWLCCVLHYGK